MKPLENITVIDLTRILTGPFCTMMLADFGAKVIKFEIPGAGDESRLLGPHINDESGYFMSVNRGKQSVTLDLRTPEGKHLLKEMAKEADVLIENYRPGTMDKWGLGYDEIKKINPRLIYASISGFGHSGPYMEKPAYDIVVQGMSGIMGITGQQDGVPTRVGTSIGDIVPALFTTVGIMMALYSRTFTGQGQRLDVAMFDSLVAILENALIRYQATGEVPEPIGNRHPAITPFDSFAAKDGYLIVAAGNPKLFENLCKILNIPELLSDPRFNDPHVRHQHHKELKPILEEAFSRFTQAEVLALLGKAGIPCSPVNRVDRIMTDPQVAARDMLVDVEHPMAGILKLPGIPIKMSMTPGEIKAPAPLLGQHTEEVLSGILGLTKEQISSLRERKVI